MGAHSALVLRVCRALRPLATLLLPSAFPNTHHDVVQVSWLWPTHLYFCGDGDTLSPSPVKTVHGFWFEYLTALFVFVGRFWKAQN